MRQNPMTVLLRLCFCAALLLPTGCARSVPTIRLQRLEPPSGLLTCESQPGAPTGNFTQRTVADFILRLAAAGEDCREKLAAVREWTVQ